MACTYIYEDYIGRTSYVVGIPASSHGLRTWNMKDTVQRYKDTISSAASEAVVRRLGGREWHVWRGVSVVGAASARRL